MRGMVPPRLPTDTARHESGVQHSRQRKLLNPVFSVNHMRHMIPIFYDVTYRVSSINIVEEGTLTTLPDSCATRSCLVSAENRAKSTCWVGWDAQRWSLLGKAALGTRSIRSSKIERMSTGTPSSRSCECSRSLALSAAL